VSLAALELFARVTKAIMNLKEKQGEGAAVSITFACLSYLCRSAWLEESMWAKCKTDKQKKSVLC